MLQSVLGAVWKEGITKGRKKQREKKQDVKSRVRGKKRSINEGKKVESRHTPS